MKKRFLTIFALVIFAAGAVNAQEFKKFRVGTGLGYAKPGGKGAGGGLLWALEPGYRVNDQILANLRIEGAIVTRGTVTDTGGDFDVAGISSYTLNGQYYFNNNGFRPFAGLGFGMFSLAGVSMSATTSGASSASASAAQSKIGFYPRLGFDAGHFTFCIDYNFLPNTEATATVSSGTGTTTTTYEFKNSYIGFRIGGYFGGGRK
jgi:hypothetical protein